MTSDALSSSDGTQPPDVSIEPSDAGPAPEPPLAGLELPRLPDLPRLTDLSSVTDAAAHADAHAAAHADADIEQPEDEVPTPPRLPAVSAADVPAVGPVGAEPETRPAFSMPTPSPAARPGAFPMSAQPPSRPARPPVRDAEPSLLGLTRRSRTRVGRLAFKWIFVVIFAVILIQMIVALLTTR